MLPSIAIILAGLVAPLMGLAVPVPDSDPKAPLCRGLSISQQQIQARQYTQDDPDCNLDALSLPSYINHEKIPAPQANTKLLLIALGIGTQNYTCSTNATEAPKAIGAVARLTNATCAVARGELDQVPEGPPYIGRHYFLDFPDFNVPKLGNAIVNKTHSQDAEDKEANVAYLRLETLSSRTANSAVREVYRVATQGGVAPKNCAGQEPGKVITVPYKAQYWFYGNTQTISGGEQDAQGQ
jgi:hypothetical protein